MSVNGYFCVKKEKLGNFAEWGNTKRLPLGGKLSTKLTDEGQFQIRYNFL